MFRNLSILSMAVLFVFGLTLAGLSQRTGRSTGSLPQVFIQRSDGSVDRGWLKREDRKDMFIDMKGNSNPVGKGEHLTTLTQMSREFQQYQRTVMAQNLNDTERYSKMLDWARNHKYYEGVIDAATRLIRLNMSNPDPEVQRALRSARDQLDAIKAGPTPTAGEGWTLDDVQKVRFALLPPPAKNAGNLQVVFKNNAVRRFVDEMVQNGKLATREDQMQFLRTPSTRQAQIIKQQTGNKFQPDIVIGKDPLPIVDFRKLVLPLVTRSCATAACHGGDKLQLKLLPKSPNVAEIYANFYALDTYQGEKGNLINRDEPERSLLLNYLLPPVIASDKLSHPKTATPFIPPLKSKSDPRYAQILAWLKSLPAESIETQISEGEITTTQPAQIKPKPPAEDE